MEVSVRLVTRVTRPTVVAHPSTVVWLLLTELADLPDDAHVLARHQRRAEATLDKTTTAGK